MIGVIGVSHKSAPVKIREKLAFGKDDANGLAQSILQIKYFKEVLVLSTCNRTEIYFIADEICASGAFKTISSTLPISKEDPESIKNHLYHYFHKEAIRHLFRVVAGLDSMMLGEYQIVAQVKEAFSNAEENKAVGKIFKRLFHKAFESGKSVRTKTLMNKGAFSVSYAAVEKCYQQFPDLADRNILLIGAGDTGELVIKNLAKKGCRNISIVNRTYEKSEELAEAYNGKAIPYENIMRGIHDAEIIVSSVSTKEPLFDSQVISPHINGHERIMMIDLGVPRNIHPDVGEIPKVNLLNVDDLNEVVALNAERKNEYVSVAENIVEEKVSEFTDWLNVQNLSPAIANINKMVARFFDEEREYIQLMLSEEDLIQFDKKRKQLSKKMRNQLVKNLRTVTENGRLTEFIAVANQMFETPHETSQEKVSHKKG